VTCRRSCRGAARGSNAPNSSWSIAGESDRWSPQPTVDCPESVPEVITTGRDLRSYSLQNFLALSNTQFTAVGWTELLVVVEAFVGALLVALLVFVLGRRATR
jgi:hypothetical protein